MDTSILLIVFVLLISIGLIIRPFISINEIDTLIQESKDETNPKPQASVTKAEPVLSINKKSSKLSSLEDDYYGSGRGNL